MRLLATLPSVNEENRVNTLDKIYLYHGWGYEFVTQQPGNKPVAIIYLQIESCVLKRQFEAALPDNEGTDLHRAARNIIVNYAMNDYAECTGSQKSH
jgi:hypothetical protein